LGIKLTNLLLQKRSTILQKWFHLILETYPADTQRFLKEQKNRFANPVGSTIFHGIEGLFEELLRGMDCEKLLPFLDNIIRIRAVQDFSPSQAIVFIPLLKKIIREELESEIRENRLLEELLEFESRIDQLALQAFDIYMRCREKVYEIQAKELRNRSSKLLERINLIHEKRERKKDL